MLNLLASGGSTEEVAKEAGCSVYTVRRFKSKHWDEIRALQAASTAGVLAHLKELLPKAVKVLQTALETPGVMNADLNRFVRTTFAAFDTMRDVDLEERIKALEKKLDELRLAVPAARQRPSASGETFRS